MNAHRPMIFGLRYKGRIISILLVISLYIFWSVYTYSFQGSLPKLDEPRFWVTLFVSILEGVLAWWIGKRFDLVRFYAERDCLTGAYNRRWVYTHFYKYVHHLHQGKHTRVTLVDLNDFKYINDHYGHEMGDFVLTEIAGILNERITGNGVVSRWGGDEFLMIEVLSGHSTTEANEIETFVLSNGLEVSGAKGIVYCYDGNCDLDQLVSEADKKMYEHK
ncbi:GGDEF domain-containing protein [Pontibacillus yanchengensis]|nr:GGDEF domain-containing protein [Pontibacillus yanchengensis]